MKRLKLIRELFPLTKGYRTTYFLNFFLVIISGIMKISTPFFVLQALRKNLCKFKNCDKSDILERLKNNRSNFYSIQRIL